MGNQLFACNNMLFGTPYWIWNSKYEIGKADEFCCSFFKINLCTWLCKVVWLVQQFRERDEIYHLHPEQKTMNQITNHGQRSARQCWLRTCETSSRHVQMFQLQKNPSSNIYLFSFVDSLMLLLFWFPEETLTPFSKYQLRQKWGKFQILTCLRFKSCRARLFKFLSMAFTFKI